jgi:hypothetical protein
VGRGRRCDRRDEPAERRDPRARLGADVPALGVDGSRSRERSTRRV